MRASLTIGGIEVVLSTPSGGALETAVAERYAPFLGAVEAPVCSLTLEPSPGAEGPPTPAVTLVERIGETTFHVVHPGLFGVFDLAGAGIVDVGPNPYSLDNALRLLFGLLAPRYNALMLHATSVICNGGAHVFTGPAVTSNLTSLAGDRPILTDGLVLVRRERDGWLAASTPFWAAFDQPGPPRESTLCRMWSLLPAGAEVATYPDRDTARLAIVDHLFLPTTEPEIQRAALDLSADLAKTVPFSGLYFSGGRAVWAEVDVALA